MDDYISRQAAIDVLATMQGLCTSKTALVQNSKIWQQIKDLPSADVQPVRHGVWMEENRRPRSAMFYCSECHRTAYDIQPTRDKTWAKRCRYAYCPNCGARMGGD